MAREYHPFQPLPISRRQTTKGIADRMVLVLQSVSHVPKHSKASAAHLQAGAALETSTARMYLYRSSVFVHHMGEPVHLIPQEKCIIRLLTEFKIRPGNMLLEAPPL